MEVGSEVKDFKVGDKVVSTLNTFVSNGLILSFGSTLYDHILGNICIEIWNMINHFGFVRYAICLSLSKLGIPKSS